MSIPKTTPKPHLQTIPKPPPQPVSKPNPKPIQVFSVNCCMGKILFSTLLIFFSGQILAQNNANKGRLTGTTNGFQNASLKSESVLKMNIFSPLLGYSQFALEKSINDLRGVEFGLGIIGAGKNLNIQPHTFAITRSSYGGNHYRPGHKNQFGGFLEFGYKFKKPLNFKTKSQNNFGTANSFEGLYIKPSFIFGAYSFNQFRDDSTTVTVRRHHRFGALLANFGHQWVFDSRIVLDFYFGAGAEIDNVKDGDDLYGHPFVLAIAKDNPSVNFAFTAGFRFGFLF
jgi:hypothetical protein